MSQTITIEIPVWVFFCFAGLIVLNGLLQGYAAYLKYKIAKLKDSIK